MSVLDDFFDDHAEEAASKRPLTSFEKDDTGYLGYATALSVSDLGFDVIVMCSTVEGCVLAAESLCPGANISEELIVSAKLATRAKGGL